MRWGLLHLVCNFEGRKLAGITEAKIGYIPAPPLNPTSLKVKGHLINSTFAEQLLYILTG